MINLRTHLWCAINKQEITRRWLVIYALCFVSMQPHPPMIRLMIYYHQHAMSLLQTVQTEKPCELLKERVALPLCSFMAATIKTPCTMKRGRHCTKGTKIFFKISCYLCQMCCGISLVSAYKMETVASSYLTVS